MCRRWFFLVFTFAVLSSASVRAQDTPVRLVSTDPAPLTANMPLEATITFEFDRQLAPSSSEWNTMVVLPRENLRLREVQLCVNAEPCGGTGPQRFVRYLVTHEPNSDYTWLVYYVSALDGSLLEAPFSLTYTTGDAVGSLSVSGAVVQAGVSTRAAPDLAALVRSSLVRSVGQLPFPPAQDFVGSPDGRAPKAPSGPPIANPEGAHTRVLLLEAFDPDDTEWTARYGDVLKERAGTFSLSGVRPGTYWPVAAHYTGSDALTLDGFGFYDPDGDLQPDSLILTSAGADDLEIPLYTFELSTALPPLERAQDVVDDRMDDAELYLIRAGYGARPTGDAYLWTYRYLSAATGRMLSVHVDPLEAVPDTTQLLFLIQPGQDPIPTEGIVDTDVALEAVQDQAGGIEFLEPYRPQNITTLIEGGNLISRTRENKDRPLWWVQYVAELSQQRRTFTALVDMETGQFLDDEPTTSAEAGVEVPAIIQLGKVYPNPIRARAVIPFDVQRGGGVTLTVHDVLGREVAVLANAVYGPGSHEVGWDVAHLPNGVYLLRLEEGGAMRTRSVVVQK